MQSPQRLAPPRLRLALALAPTVILSLPTIAGEGSGEAAFRQLDPHQGGGRRHLEGDALDATEVVGRAAVSDQEAQSELGGAVVERRVGLRRGHGRGVVGDLGVGDEERVAGRESSRVGGVLGGAPLGLGVPDVDDHGGDDEERNGEQREHDGEDAALVAVLVAVQESCQHHDQSPESAVVMTPVGATLAFSIAISTREWVSLGVGTRPMTALPVTLAHTTSALPFAQVPSWT